MEDVEGGEDVEADSLFPDVLAGSVEIESGGTFTVSATISSPYDSPERYADACHLCYESCRALRGQFPEVLLPDQMYGVAED